MKKEWFNAWFDSPYYHILYKNHDEQEAGRALEKMVIALKLSPGARILDLGCGKGRHSRFLAEKGFDVTGVDISESSIQYARQFEAENLSFFLHDMRKSFRIGYFDAIMNMFTSFGYFKDDTDHFKTIQNAALGLRKDGLLLIDFFNSAWVRAHLVRHEIKQNNGIEFHLRRTIRGGYVYKSIEFRVDKKRHFFRERVRLFALADFSDVFAKAGLKIINTFGDYDLNLFDKQACKRLIIVGKKQ